MAERNLEAEMDSLEGEIDRSLLRENLKLTPAERLEKFVRFMRFASELQRAGEMARAKQASASDS